MAKNIRQLAALLVSEEISNAQISRECKVDRNTVPKYRERAKAAGISAMNLVNFSNETLKQVLYPPRERPKIHEFDLPNWEQIEKELLHPNTTNMFLHERYAESAQNPMSYSVFCRILKQRQNKKGPVLRQPRFPGREVLVDFSGKRPEIIEKESGQVTKVELFVACLGYSKKAFAYAVRTQSTEDWIKAHVEMFNYFGGVPKYVVPDNLKAAVIRSQTNLKGQKLNEKYVTMLSHYGATALAARPYKPQDKGLVEQSVLHLQRWVLRSLVDQKFHSLQELNTEILKLIEKVNSKPMKLANGLSRQDLFEQKEACRLRQLPSTPFNTSVYIGSRTVPTDYHIAIEGQFYSVPYGLIGRKVEIFRSKDCFFFYDGMDCVAVHISSQARIGSVNTSKSHPPINHSTYIENRDRHFETWGRYQCKAIRIYLRKHLECWKNPNATECASKQLQKLCEQHNMEQIESVLNWIATCLRSSPLSIDQLKISNVKTLLSKPLGALEFDEILENHEVNVHENVRGAKYYK